MRSYANDSPKESIDTTAIGDPLTLRTAFLLFICLLCSAVEPIDTYDWICFLLSLNRGVVVNQSRAITQNMSPLMTNRIVENIWFQ